MKTWLWRHREAVGLVALSFISLALNLLSFDAYVIGQMTDDALYIQLARALASGEGFRETYYPTPQPHCLAPPGYPLVLVPLISLFPNNWFLLKLLSALSLVAALWLLRPLVRRMGRPEWVLSIVALTALAPVWLSAGVRIMTDAFYMAVAVASLLAIDGARRARKISPPMWAALGLVALLPLVRSVGFIIVLAGAATLLLTRKIRLLLALVVPAAITTMAWSVRNRRVGCGLVGPSSYFDSPDLWLETIRSAGRYAWIEIPQTMVPALGAEFGTVTASTVWTTAIAGITATLLILLILGFVERLSEGHTLLVLYTAGHLGLLALFGSDAVLKRYLIPVLPMLWIFTFAGARIIWTRLQQTGWSIPRWLLVALAAGFGLGMALQYAYYDTRPLFDPVKNRIPDVRVGATWIRDHTPADATVMVSEPRSASFWSERTVVYYPSADEADLARTIALYNVNYLLVTPPLVAFGGLETHLEPAAAEAIRAYAEDESAIDKVFEDKTAGVYVFEVKDPDQLRAGYVR